MAAVAMRRHDNNSDRDLWHGSSGDGSGNSESDGSGGGGLVDALFTFGHGVFPKRRGLKRRGLGS